MKASHHRITFVPVAWATVVALVAVTYVAVPVQSWIRVRDQLSNLVAIEDGTTDTYRQVLRKFTNGRTRVDTRALTELIDGSIVPQLSRAAADLSALGAETPEHRALVVSAREYLRLREASWRLRAEGLKKGNIRLLQQADRMEQSSMEALRPLKELKSDPREPPAASDAS